MLNISLKHLLSVTQTQEILMKYKQFSRSIKKKSNCEIKMNLIFCIKVICYFYLHRLLASPLANTGHKPIIEH